MINPRVSGKAALAGVIGCPVAHSLSPRLHNYWLSHYAIDGMYMPLAITPEDLPECIHALVKMGFRGFNLTVPHKEAVIGLLDRIDDTAHKIGAVNTVVISDKGELLGSNSDAYGFAENIRPHLNASRAKAVILGAGGAAKAVCHALVQLGFKDIIITNRTLARAEAMAKDISGARVEAWERRHLLLQDADLVVNTTSLGLKNNPPLELDLATLPPKALVTDIIYTPLMTPLLMAAQARGNAVVDGLGMLLYQAIPGFSAWFGQTPDVTPALRDYILHA